MDSDLINVVIFLIIVVGAAVKQVFTKISEFSRKMQESGSENKRSDMEELFPDQQETPRSERPMRPDPPYRPITAPPPPFERLDTPPPVQPVPRGSMRNLPPVPPPARNPVPPVVVRQDEPIPVPDLMQTMRKVVEALSGQQMPAPVPVPPVIIQPTPSLELPERPRPVQSIRKPKTAPLAKARPQPSGPGATKSSTLPPAKKETPGRRPKIAITRRKARAGFLLSEILQPPLALRRQTAMWDQG